MSSSANGWAGPRSLGLGRAFSACSASRRSSLRGDLQVDRRAGHDGHRLAQPLDQLRVVGGREIAALGVGFQQQLAAKDLRRLRFPQPLAGDGLLDLATVADPLERAGHGNGEDRRAGLLGRLEDLGDPLVGQARPGGVVDADEIGLGLDSGQRALRPNRPAPLPPSTTSMPRIATLAENLKWKSSRSSGDDDQDRLAPRRRGSGTVRPSAATRPGRPTAQTASCSSGRGTGCCGRRRAE